MSKTRELMANNLKVKIFENRSEMGEAAAVDVAKKIKALLSTQDFVNIIFAAAPSQNEFLSSLTEHHELDWGRINAFHMDEYVGLKEDDPERFANFLKKKIFDNVPFHKVHYLDGDFNDPYPECERYTRLLEKHPPDIVCMGIGENAHLAFNDPHVADFNDPLVVKVVELAEASRLQQVHDDCFTMVDDVPTSAITLTVPALMQANSIFCIVPGQKKAEAIYHTLFSEIDANHPSTILRKHEAAILYLDKNSAGKLLR
ncbi:MAG: glucosamine-6-phosphate deaminase [Ginsengibacter sp.]